MKVIAIANQKGGVGKTTSAVNIASAMALGGKKTLLIDVDPQGNATSALSEKLIANEEDFNVYHLFINPACIKQAINASNDPCFFSISANHELVKLDQLLANNGTAYSRLKDALALIDGDFDYVIIDCPPSLSLIPLNCFNAADSILIPIQAEYYPLEGLSQIVEILELVKSHGNENLQVEGILVTMFDHAQDLAHEVFSQIQKNFPDKLFQQVIPRDSRLAEAPSYGESIFDYAPTSLGALSYGLLVEEIFNKQG